MTTHAYTYLTKSLLPAYHLDDGFLRTLSEVGAYIWGSAVIRAMMDGATWEPNDIDILVKSEEEAAAAAAALNTCGYDRILEIEPNEENRVFIDTRCDMWYFQQWIDVAHGKARRVVKIWIGDIEGAFAAADLSCCRVGITVRDNGMLKFHGRLGAFRVLIGDPDDCDPYSRITKYKQRFDI
jgi:hypothetical protein